VSISDPPVATSAPETADRVTEPATAPTEDVCLGCGASLAADQEWCLECGSARTIIHRPPDWRIPLGIVGGVVFLMLAAFAIALINLSSNATRSAQTQTTASTPRPQRTAPAPPKPAARPAPPTFAGWPTGLGGWTVEIAVRRRRVRAETTAQRIARMGVKVGVLNSSKHPSMTPGYWVVFSGRYPTESAAVAATTQLRKKGLSLARARRVAPPGGI
jgi:septal ring-binding cell division protein DamX